MNDQYSILAKYYDILNSEINYAEWAKFIDGMFKKYGDVNLVLDLACGSGRMTAELAALGYDMIGIDISVDMLIEACKRVGDVLLLNQDMRSFELYGTVDAVVCCLDSVNYLLNESDIKKCFSLVHNYLNPNGLFIFDVNTQHKFENIFAEHDYVLEDDGILCAWRNCYDRETCICDFILDIFVKEKDSYKRYSETQSERMYTDETLNYILQECKFEILETDKRDKERCHYICKKI
ncbi:MAG: class I SAM-dependent methyltransferase [Oscillospiraceae bacterium]|nr:class I SAM-dependent methyltransferase [Oscillospiraceae bacterium]